MSPSSRRLIAIGCLVVTIALGLFSRSRFVSDTSVFGQYAGDTLWAMAVFWGLAMLAPQSTTKRLCLTTLVISVAIELSQLYHAAWIDVIRANPIAALILGHTFVWSDLVCYTLGAFLAAIAHHRLK
ncbi:DUF2809 domain-containing protein [Verrucomicrobiaceae bacterium 5K15]|uniref:DUF2809 domain-containing protein n=1 Tax=Oceaniferula flava TaxID=2800421 RepID=A0AAE2SAB4_9BACT|nr:DUF2809 domain-containing protein [Oceaniferula flavus]MBK1853717.1 DUF2809 domain-containing protein [Oceaniferula flavus]MBM1135023.1 DUF2809 domain-containing protein [Oceaniferula flavus]